MDSGSRTDTVAPWNAPPSSHGNSSVCATAALRERYRLERSLRRAALPLSLRK